MARPEAENRARLVRAPVAGLPQLHQLILPTPWDVGPVQVYLLEGEPLTLIDTGVRNAASREALTRLVGELGYALSDIGRILLTHWHEDHLGQAQTVREAGADCEVWVHEAEASMCAGFSPERNIDIPANAAVFREAGVPGDLMERLIERWRAHRGEDPLCEPTRVDRTLQDGDAIDCGVCQLDVIHAPGHTAGHMLLAEDESGVLLTGDHVMGGAVPFTTTYPVGPAAPDDPLARRARFRGLPAYMASIRRLRGGSFRTILPAHGGILERPSRAIADALLFYEVRVQRVERALRELAGGGEPATPWELWRHLFPKHDPLQQLHHRLMMTIGALDVLEEQGLALAEPRADGLWGFRPGG